MRFAKELGERGASMVEYAFLAILIAVVAFFAVQTVGTELSVAYQSTADGFDTED